MKPETLPGCALPEGSADADFLFRDTARTRGLLRAIGIFAQ